MIEENIPERDVDASLIAAVVDALILTGGRKMLDLQVEALAKSVLKTLFAHHTAWAVELRLRRGPGNG